MRRALVGCIVACLWCAGCGAPSWIGAPPTSGQYIYAVGRWPATYYADQRQRAADEARSEIARVTHSRVNELVLRVHTRYNTSTVERIRRVTSSISAADLENCEIVEFWKDEKGRAGPQDTLYALARISRSDAANAIRRAAGADLQDQEQRLLEQILEQLKGNVREPP